MDRDHGEEKQACNQRKATFSACVLSIKTKQILQVLLCLSALIQQDSKHNGLKQLKPFSSPSGSDLTAQDDRYKNIILHFHEALGGTCGERAWGNEYSCDLRSHATIGLLMLPLLHLTD